MTERGYSSGVHVVERIREFLAEQKIEPSSVLLAVSGGIDSTALLLAFAELREEGWDVAAAHVNHHLRGEDSDGDERFVRDLCARLDVPIDVCDGMLEPDRVRDVGIEAAAREIRYRRLSEVRNTARTRYLATAHQMDDQAETVLMRLVSGGGIASMRGVHSVRDGWILRPLLRVRRSELEAFLASRGITARHDLSNDDPRFLRNRIRRIVADFGATASLAGFAAEMQEQWPLIEAQLVEMEARHVVALPHETRFRSFPENAWARQALLHRHINRLDPAARNVSAVGLRRLARGLEQIRRVSVTGRLELVRQHDEWVLRAPPVATPEFEITASPGAPAFLPHLNQSLHVEPHHVDPHHGAPDTSIRYLVQLPDRAEPRFTVRNRRDGDRFQPLGLSQPKKLKDFLIDRRIAVELRNSIPLLLWNDEIVLVVGVEVSERFKVTTPAGELFHVWMEEPGAEDDQADLQR